MTREEAERRAWEQAGDILLDSPLEGDEWHLERERLAFCILDTLKSKHSKGHNVNITGYRSFDRIAQDPRIVKVWLEGSDGVWAELAPGFNAEGCSTLHVCHPFDRTLTVREMVVLMRSEMSRIEIGSTY